jgi:hypothetical protein
MSQGAPGLSEIEVQRVRQWAAKSVRLWLLLSLVFAAAVIGLLAAGELINALFIGLAAGVGVLPMLLLSVRRGVRVRRLGVGAPTVLLEGLHLEPRGRQGTRRLAGELIELAAPTPPPAHQARVRARAVGLDALGPLVVRQSWLVVEWLP